MTSTVTKGQQVPAQERKHHAGPGEARGLHGGQHHEGLEAWRGGQVHILELAEWVCTQVLPVTSPVSSGNLFTLYASVSSFWKPG